LLVITPTAIEGCRPKFWTVSHSTTPCPVLFILDICLYINTVVTQQVFRN